MQQTPVMLGQTVRTWHLTPMFEQVALRWGLYEGEVHEGRFRIPLSALQPLPCPLGREEDGWLVLPEEAPDREAFRRTRRSFREFLARLSEHHPERLGRTSRRVFKQPRTTAVPTEPSLERSRAYLTRAYDGAFIPAEKKGIVVDLRTCSGLYMTSVDQDEHGPRVALLDSSSQIASFLSGFNAASLRGVLSHPEAFLNPDWRHGLDAADAFARLLRREAHPALSHVCFVNSGTEALEKAFGLARLKHHDPNARRVLAFQGSFHGRTLLSLFSSWNPEKRVPFEIAGFETVFVEYPEDKQPHLDRPAPAGWAEFWAQPTEQPRFDTPDALLAREVQSLLAVREKLVSGEIFAVAIEPFQAEGGDRYASPRFYQALRLLTKSLRVPLVIDEVQSGLGLGGTFFWHTQLDLPAPPDFVCLAKKTQAGVVLSSIPDPTPTAAHAASILRGYFNALSVDLEAIRRVGAMVAPRLQALAEKHAVVQNPRGRGLCFAFDMPDKDMANAVINQRFARGYLVYIAGELTLRYRLQTVTSEADLDVVFRAIDRSLERLNNPEWASDYAEPCATELPERPNAVLRAYGQLSDAEMAELEGASDVPPLRRQREQATLQGARIHVLTPQLWQQHRAGIVELENRVYEPARRDTVEWFEEILGMPRHIALVALQDGKVVGFSFAGPLDFVGRVRGPHEDPELGKGTTLYSADITVAPEMQGQGVGQRLKEAQLEQARRFGYHAVRSRNRVGKAAQMSLINRTLGAVEVHYYEDDYGDDHAPCLYSSIPLRTELDRPVHWSNGVEEPTGAAGLDAEDWADWDLSATHKLSMCNWITPQYVHYMEWLRETAPPELRHAYLSNGRDEAADKAIKSLRFHRPRATTCISFLGSYWGHTTAAARSLSDPAFASFFPWQHVPFPDVEGSPLEGRESALLPAEQAALALVESLLAQPDSVIGVFIEPIQEMTGRRVSVRFLAALHALCAAREVPLVFNESASWAYRGSPHLYYSSGINLVPDAVVTYAGGQLGQTLVRERWFVSKPLAMISTWDGDELSALRLREQIRRIESVRDEGFLCGVDARIGGHTWRGSGWVELAGTRRLRKSLRGGEQYVLMPPLLQLHEHFDALQRELT
ncbi:MAG: aminotransferase class III-fold pyridoxal phosphate-dependent enzyme [Candidatus Xenobia bacterium]